MTATIPALSKACKLHQRIAERNVTTESQEREWRATLLQAVAAGATRVQIMSACPTIRPNELESALRQARQETADPELAKTRMAKGGLTLGEYWCSVPGCPRSEGNGNQPLGSAQALGMHKVASHGYKLGEKALTAQMVRKARADKTTPTSVLARKWKVSTHALGAARKGRTWRNV